MRRLFGPTLLIILVLLFTSVANAGKPEGDGGIYIGNGFPSGPHFNLNVIAKKAGFTCPEQQFLCSDGGTESTVLDCGSCNGTCQPLYGGTIFVPQATGSDITILMESGAKGPKGNLTATSLEVTDPCTQAFDGGPAAFRLPADPDGYAVYARVTGDPKENPQFDFTNPRFKYVMDESGNDLVLLGFVTNSVFDSDGEALPSRYDSTQKGKGVQKGVNITPLFRWSGQVCYLEQNDLASYCGWVDSNANFIVDEVVPGCSASPYCCLDEYGDGDYEYCEPTMTGDSCPGAYTNLCCVDTDPELLNFEYCQPLTEDCPAVYDYHGEMLSYTSLSPVNYQAITAWCKNYETASGEGVWVFNIADFVGLLFDIESTGPNTGSSVIQLRFYPLPLNTK